MDKQELSVESWGEQMIIQEACKNNAILQSANPTAHAKMLSYGRIRKYKKGELIFREREDVNQLFFLVAGYVALFRINGKQDRKIIFVYGNNEMLNEVIVQDPVASISCMALSDVKILCFSRDQFREIMESDSRLTIQVMDSLATKLRRCYRQLSNTPNAMCIDCQVASKLWKLSRDFGVVENGVTRITFDLSITFLADMVGAKRETVSRVISKFKREGYIKLQKHKMLIIDAEALRQYAAK